jgi:hypothetical protein
MTEQQFFARLAQPVTIPPDVSTRIRHRVMTEARKLRKLHQLHRRSQLRRRVAGVVVALVLFVLAAGSAEASVYLALIKTPPVISASPPECFECYRAYLPAVEVP